MRNLDQRRFLSYKICGDELFSFLDLLGLVGPRFALSSYSGNQQLNLLPKDAKVISVQPGFLGEVKVALETDDENVNCWRGYEAYMRPLFQEFQGFLKATGREEQVKELRQAFTDFLLKAGQ